MECVLVLRGDTDTSWSHGKALLVEEGDTIGTSPTPSLNLFTELERINLETITSKQLSTIRAALKVCATLTYLKNCLTAIISLSCHFPLHLAAVRTDRRFIPGRGDGWKPCRQGSLSAVTNSPVLRRGDAGR